MTTRPMQLDMDALVSSGAVVGEPIQREPISWRRVTVGVIVGSLVCVAAIATWRTEPCNRAEQRGLDCPKN